MEVSDTNVICIQSPAFYKLVDTLTEYIREKHSVKKEKWVGEAEAMKSLGIKSKTTLQQLRDNGKIRYTQPQKKLIMYDTQSIDLYLESHAKNTF